VVDIVSVCAEVIGLDKRNFFAHLGAFWSKDFAPKYFKSWFIMAMSAKEFAKQLDRIYAILHNPNSNSEKTHIQYNWLDSDTLRLEYQMDADYLELFEALARGIATYYKPDIRIEKHQNSVTIFHFE
jgi:hypothetical protein